MADTETRTLHKTARWQQLRWSVLLRDQFTCQICRRLEGDTSKQTLCKPCHDGQKQKEEVAARAAGLDVYGGKQASYRPDWLRPSAIPLTIVCGPPASGKSHYVRQHAGSTDLVIDLDLIVANLSGKPASHGWDWERWLQMALRKRNAMLGELSKQPSWPSAWLIMTEPSAERRAWWAGTMKPKAIIVIEAKEATCMAHAAHDADRDQHHTMLMVRRWWSEYRPRSDDQIVRP